MTPLAFVAIEFAVALFAGWAGALLGLGGGIIVIPALTLGLGVDIRYAIGASIVAVIATSSGAAAAYVRERLTNVRVALLLEIATTAGAVSGALLAGVLAGRWLYVIFGGLMCYSAAAMVFKPRLAHKPVGPDAWADRLQLHGAYFDETLQQEQVYRVGRSKLGLMLMYVAGGVSGLLGIGSGALKVPAMDLAMGLPMKVSSATSNFMIGVTAAASAGVYFTRGDIDPFIAGPVAGGAVLGALAGSLMLNRVSPGRLRLAFVAVLLVVSFQMLHRGIAGP
jgi:uncharacterized membrane protein YfcA